jgi:hypothetical protein
MALNPTVHTTRRPALRRSAAWWTSIALLVAAAAIAVVLLFAGITGMQQTAPASPRQSGVGVPTAPQQPQVGPGHRIPRPGLPVAE